MGLDMYAHATKDDKDIQFHYWRKHNALHGWMENLWIQKGCPGPDIDDGFGSFNCIPLELTTEDLDALEKAINNAALTPTTGFFFGSTDYSDTDLAWHKDDDFEFIAKARQLLNRGFSVNYNSWW